MAERPTGPVQPRVWDLVTLGSTLVGAVVFGLVAGLLADHQLHSSPTWTLVGTAVGVVVGGAAFTMRIRSFLTK